MLDSCHKTTKQIALIKRVVSFTNPFVTNKIASNLTQVEFTSNFYYTESSTLNNKKQLYIDVKFAHKMLEKLTLKEFVTRVDFNLHFWPFYARQVEP